MFETEAVAIVVGNGYPSSTVLQLWSVAKAAGAGSATRVRIHHRKRKRSLMTQCRYPRNRCYSRAKQLSKETTLYFIPGLAQRLKISLPAGPGSCPRRSSQQYRYLVTLSVQLGERGLALRNLSVGRRTRCRAPLRIELGRVGPAPLESPITV